MFEVKESYKHLYAKKILANWCKEAEEKSDGCCQIAQFYWRKNYGVFEELPFYETSDPYYFENSGGFSPYKWEHGFKPEQCFSKRYNRGKILFVPDITIFHKGVPGYLFEIVHSNPVSIQKIEIIRSFFGDLYYTELYEINVEDILVQTKIPTRLNAVRLI